MHGRIRFQGYWFSLMAWLVLTFATPLANAVAYSEGGWLRLCSAQGATWVSLEAQAQSSGSTLDHRCPCLGQAVAMDLPSSFKAPMAFQSPFTVDQIFFVFTLNHTAIPPRSPPDFLPV